MFLGVLLSRIKLGPPEIRKALVEVDDTKLTVDDLKAISRSLPTSEEVSSQMITCEPTIYDRPGCIVQGFRRCL